MPSYTKRNMLNYVYRAYVPQLNLCIAIFQASRFRVPKFNGAERARTNLANQWHNTCHSTVFVKPLFTSLQLFKNQLLFTITRFVRCTISWLQWPLQIRHRTPQLLNLQWKTPTKSFVQDTSTNASGCRKTNTMANYELRIPQPAISTTPAFPLSSFAYPCLVGGTFR